MGCAGHGDRFAVLRAVRHAIPPWRQAEEAAPSPRVAIRAIRYRRRAENTGFKAGNIMDFLDHHAEGFELMLVLDADSEMSAAAVLRLVRHHAGGAVAWASCSI